MANIVLYLSLFFSLINPVSVINNSSSVFVEIGIGDDELLVETACELIEGYVDWDKTGEYNLVYYDFNKLDYFNKTFYVVDSKMLEDGVNIYEETTICSLEHEYFISSYVYDSDDAYFVLGEIDYNEQLKQTILTQRFAFIQYYKDDTLVFEKIFSSNYSYITWGTATGSGLIYFLTYEDGSNSKIQIGEISRSGNILRTKDFVTSADELGFKAFSSHNLMTIFFTSTSKGALWPNEEEKLVLVALQLDIRTWAVKNVLSFGNNFRNSFIDIVEENNSFYCLLTVAGDGGDFPQKDYYTNAYILTIIDNNLKLIKYRQISSLYSTPRLACGAQELYIIYEHNVFLQTNMKFYVYGLALDFMREINYLNEDYKLKYNSQARDELGNTILLFNRYESESPFSSIIMIEGTSLIEYKFNVNLRKVKALNHNYDWSIVGIENNKLKRAKLYCLKTVKYRINHYDYYDLSEKHLYFNGMFVTHLGQAPSMNKTFGYYDDKFISNINKVTLVLKNEYFINLRYNFRENEIYDLGLEITFNGDGYLNDIFIGNNATINNEGLYQLIIKGEGGLMKIINFSVKSLAKDYAYDEEIPPISLNILDDEFDAVNPAFAIINTDIIKEEKNNNKFLIISAFVLTSIICAFFIKIPWRIKK